MKMPAFCEGGDLPGRRLACQLILLSSNTQLHATGTDGVDSIDGVYSVTSQNKLLH